MEITSTPSAVVHLYPQALVKGDRFIWAGLEVTAVRDAHKDLDVFGRVGVDVRVGGTGSAEATVWLEAERTRPVTF